MILQLLCLFFKRRHICGLSLRPLGGRFQRRCHLALASGRPQCCNRQIAFSIIMETSIKQDYYTFVLWSYEGFVFVKLGINSQSLRAEQRGETLLHMCSWLHNESEWASCLNLCRSYNTAVAQIWKWQMSRQSQRQVVTSMLKLEIRLYTYCTNQTTRALSVWAKNSHLM